MSEDKTPIITDQSEYPNYIPVSSILNQPNHNIIYIQDYNNTSPNDFNNNTAFNNNINNNSNNYNHNHNYNYNNNNNNYNYNSDNKNNNNNNIYALEDQRNEKKKYYLFNYGNINFHIFSSRINFLYFKRRFYKNLFYSF